MARTEPADRALYVISVAAELAGLHPQTLRLYERRGLIEPVRTSGRSRRYSDDDIALLQRIQELTAEGLNLAGVQRVLDLEEELADWQRQVDGLERRIERLRLEAAEAIEAVRRRYRRELVLVRKAEVPVRRAR